MPGKLIRKEDDETFFGTYKQSSKMKALIDIIKKTKKDDKIIVFSHFVGMLKIADYDLRKHGVTSIVC